MAKVELRGMIGALTVALTLGQATMAQAEDSGVLLGEFGGTAADLYDPMTGKALLVPGAPLDPLPPVSDSPRIGFIDSGILPDHPQLRNLVVAMKDFTGDDPIDRIGHGTLIALNYISEEFESFSEYKRLAELTGRTVKSPALIVAKVTDAQGLIDQKHVIEAIQWLTAQGAKNIGMSLGFRGAREKYTALCKAIAQNSEVLFSAAAGNFGPNVPVYPAACNAPNLASVAAAVEERVWKKSGRGTHAAESQLRLMRPAMYYYEMAQAAARTGDLDRARQGYLASIGAEENASALFGLAVLDFDAGNFDAAYASLARAAQLAPDNALIEAELGAVLLMQQRPATAKTHLDRAIELGLENVGVRTNRAIALVQLGKPALALDDLIVARRMAEDRTQIDALILELLELLQSRSVPLPDTGETE